MFPTVIATLTCAFIFNFLASRRSNSTCNSMIWTVSTLNRWQPGHGGHCTLFIYFVPTHLSPAKFPAFSAAGYWAWSIQSCPPSCVESICFWYVCFYGDDSSLCFVFIPFSVGSSGIPLFFFSYFSSYMASFTWTNCCLLISRNWRWFHQQI